MYPRSAEAGLLVAESIIGQGADVFKLFLARFAWRGRRVKDS